MGTKLAMTLFGFVVVLELLAVIVIAGVLFWMGSPETIAVGAGMLVVALLACVLLGRRIRRSFVALHR
ncbi:hypothetical protein ACI797_16400 [Geodermatophilus sp. SYSU D00691]